MLDDSAKEKGYTLLCVSEPQSDCKVAVIEEVLSCLQTCKQLLNQIVPVKNSVLDWCTSDFLDQCHILAFMCLGICQMLHVRASDAVQEEILEEVLCSSK